jgi:hypothetical protein
MGRGRTWVSALLRTVSVMKSAVAGPEAPKRRRPSAFARIVFGVSGKLLGCGRGGPLSVALLESPAAAAEEGSYDRDEAEAAGSGRHRNRGEGRGDRSAT